MTSRITRITRQVKRVWGELDYAQRRSFEITTGIPVTPKGTHAVARTEISELEVALAQPHAVEQPILDPAVESAVEAVAI
jgi:hypothetical protein